jgi:hypothetical protein
MGCADEGCASSAIGALRSSVHPYYSVIKQLNKFIHADGTGKLFSSRTDTYNSMASLTLETALSLVLPWLMHLGKLEHSATQKPSSPG